MNYQNPSRRRASRLSTSVRLGVAAVAACFLSTPVLSLPVNPTVVNGAAGFNQTGNVLTVTNSNGTIINWQKFSIKAGETTHFAQTSASSSVLNRVLSDPTAIYGTLSSNGRVWLVNPAGIMVGPGGRVDVAGFVASTLNIRNEDFLAGRNVFINDSSAKNVINQGEIRTPAGGSVYLIGSNVTNEGIITTPKGETILAAGATVSLIDSATPGVKVDITGSEGNATNLGTITAEAGRIGIAGVIVRNSGTVNASSVVSEGGRVFLKASQDAYVDGNGRIVTTGTKGGSVEVLGNRVAIMGNAEIDASGTGDTNAGGGKILVGGDYQGKNPDIQNANVSYFGPNATLKADAGKVGDGGTVIVWADDTTRAYGSISARGGVNGGNGGFVETSGHRYLDVAGIKVLAGTWLLDPYDLTVTSVTDATISAGSPYIFTSGSGGSNVCNIDIQTQLNLGTSVVLQTGGTLGDLNGNGDITVSSAITKTGVVASDLTLKAHRSIVINAPITSVNSAMSVNLDAHFSDDSPTASGNVSIFADITTNGGNLWVGGGSTLGGTGYAIGYDTASANPYQRYGILLNNGVSISTGGGSVTMRGRGVDNATGGDADGIDMWSGSSINAGGGTIVLAGVGGNNPNVDTSGVYIAGTVQTSGTGTITIAGTGGSNSLIGANRGVHINGGTVQGQDGLVSITGTGGDGTGAYNVGILIDSGSTIQTTGTAGTGNLALIGTGGSGVNSTYENYGVLLDSSTLRSVAGSISVTGYGGGGGGTNSGIAILNQSTIEATGSGSITLEGTGGTGSGWNSGIDAWNGPNLIRTASGSISVTGYGGTAATGESNIGVWLEPYGASFDSGTTVESTKGGNVTIWGQGGSGTWGNHGVYIQGASQVLTNGGDLSITGHGGAGDTLSGYHNAGVLVESIYGLNLNNNNNVLLRPLIEATGSGNLSITGTGGTGTFNNRGVELVGASVRVRDGALSISGTGGPGSQNSNQGVALSSNSEQEVPTPEIDYSVVESIGKGAIQITGTAVADAAGSYNNNGVAIQQYSLVRSAGGAITIAGTAAGTNDIDPTDNPAVLISGSVIANSAHDSGLVTVTGKTTSGVSYGVDIDSTGAIVSTNRDVILESASADGGVYVAGNVRAENLTVSGPLTLESVYNNSTFSYLDPVLHARGLAKFDDITGINGGNVTVVAGSIDAGNIRTRPLFSGVWANSSTGAISLTANAGSITTGNLRSSLSNPASGTDTSGAITLKALDNVSTGDIATYIHSSTNSYTENSFTANAGAVSVVAQRGAINTGYIDTSSITFYTTAGRGGDVHMNAGTGISVGGILTSSEAGSGTAFIASASGGGNVILYANGGDVTTGAIDTGARVFGGNIGSSAGNAGGIILRASDNVLVDGNITTDSTTAGSGFAGYGGEVSLYALGGTLTVTGAINASSSNWYGGNVTLFSIGDTSVNNLVVTAASVPDGLTGLISSGGEIGGQVTIIGNGDDYLVGSAPNGDYIVKYANNGSISLATHIFARNIILSAAYDISTSGMIIADAGGWVSMRATNGTITVGNTVSAPGGDILLRAMGSDADGQILGTGNLFAQGSGSSFPNGGTIRLVADRDINYSGNISASADSEGGGSGGSILIQSLLGSITLGSATPLAAISANGYGNGGNGGNIEISLGGGAGDITLGTAAYALSISANGDGGYYSDGSDGGKGGNVRINALASSSGNITHFGGISVVGGWGSDSNSWPLAGGKGGDGGTVIIEAGAGGSATLGSMIDASGANGGQGYFTDSGAIPYDTRGGDGGKGGSISVTAPGAVSVEYLTANGGGGNDGRPNGNSGDGGFIELMSTGDNVTVSGAIKAVGGNYFLGCYYCDGWGGDGGKGGTVKLKAYGEVNVLNVGSYIDVSGGNGYRGGDASTYNYSEPTRGGNGGEGGTVLIEAQTNIALNDWIYANGGSGGFGFRVTDGVLWVYTTPGGDGGKGGTVSLTSYGGTVAAGGIDAYGRSGGAGRIGGNGGDGGSVALNGDGGVTVGSFALPGEIDASGGSTYGSDNSQGGNGGKGGSVEIKSTTGGVTVYGSIYITGGYGATGGNNYPDSTVLPISAGHGGDGGTLTIEAQTDISLPDWVYVNGGSGGNGLWDDNLGAYVSPGGNGGKGGDVSITSYGGTVAVGGIDAWGRSGGGGRIGGNGGDGGSVSLNGYLGVTAYGGINAPGGQNSYYYSDENQGGNGGKGGTVGIKSAAGSVSVYGGIQADGGEGGSGGNNYRWSLNSEGSVYDPSTAFIAGGRGGDGGKVSIEAYTDVTLTAAPISANAGSGGAGLWDGDNNTAYLTPGGAGGNGNSVSILAHTGSVLVGSIYASGGNSGAGVPSGNGGYGGNISVVGKTGVTVAPWADGFGGWYDAYLEANGGHADTDNAGVGGRGGKGGSIALVAGDGDVLVTGYLSATGGYSGYGVAPTAYGGDGGSVEISLGGWSGDAVTKTTTAPHSITVYGGIDVSGGNAYGPYSDGVTAAASGGNGGDVVVTTEFASLGGSIGINGDIYAWGGSGGMYGQYQYYYDPINPGYYYWLNYTGPGGNGGTGGSVTLRATGSAADIAMIGNIDVSGGWRGDGTNGAPHGLGGDGGTVTAQSVGNISLATIYGDGGEGGGSGSTVLIESTTGSISVDRTHANASADWGTPPPDVASGPGTDGGHGGNITLRVTQPVLASFIDAGWISANGADGGSTLDIAAPAGAGGAGGIVRLEFGTSAAPGSIGGAVSLYQSDLGAGWSGCDSVACSVTQASQGSVTAIAYGGNLTVGRSSDRTDLTTSAATFIGVTSSDALSLQAPNGMVLSGSGSNGLFSGTPAYFIDASAQSIKVSAGSGIGTAGAPLKVDSSALNFSNAASDVFIGSDYTLSVDAGLSSSGGNISLTGVGVTNSGSITGTGGVTIDAGTGMLSNAAGSIISTEGSISLIADAMTLAGGTITAPGNDYLNINNPGSVFLTTSLISAPRDITLGGTGSGLNLSSTDLQTITATNGLVIGGNPECTSSPGFCVGRNSSGNLTVSGPTDLTGVGGVWGLALMTSGSITVNSPLSTTGGVSLDGVSVTNSSSITGTHVALTADTMSLSGGTISAGVSGVDLRTYTMGRSISLGAAGTNTLDISSADLQSISSTGGLRIGDGWNTPGGVTVTGPITLIDLAGLTGGSLVLQSATNSIEVNAALASPVPVELSADGMGTISEGSGGSIAAPSLVTRSVNSTTLNGANAVDSFAAPQFVPNGQSVLTDNGVVSLTNTTPTLTLGQVNVGSLAVHNTGAIAISPAGYVNASGAGDAIVLDASTGFTNNATLAASALTTSGGGRWLIYAPDPVSVTKNGLTLASYQYNTSYGGTVAPTGNGFVYVSPLFVDANFSGTLSSTFGANPTATPGYALRGLDVDDTATAAAITGSATYSNWPITGSSAATSYTLQYVSGLTPALPYALTPGTSQTYTVNPAILAYTINASLQGTAQKIYDGNTDATLTPGNFLLAGFVNGDMADVTKTTGTYLTRNVGSGIQISTSLAGSDFNWTAGNASNYILPTIAVGNIGVITQLGSVTWTGGATGNWSLASNWAGGALPDAQNVANVVIPGGKVVTFDSGVVPTTLTSISSLGGLVINSGSLAVNSSLATQTYQQTGGSLTGTGGFTVTDSFAQTGGSIALTGAAPVSITQTAGDARVGSLSNAGGAVTITANNAILDENGAALNITANSVNLTSAYGGTAGGLAISLDTAASNQLTATVSSGNGGIYLRNFTASAPATINLTDSGSSNPGIAFYQDSNLSLGGASFYGGTGNIVVGAGGSMSGIQSSRFGGTPANIILIADSGMSMSGALASSGNIGLSAATLDIGAALSGANVTLNGSTTLNVSATTAATGDLLAGAGVMNINATGSMTAGNNMTLGATTIDVNGLVMAGNNIELAATTINIYGGNVSAVNNAALVTPLVGGTINLAYGGGVSAGANGTPSSINGIPYQGIAFVAQNVTADGGFLNAGGLTGDISGLMSGNVTLKNGAYFSAGNDIELVLAGSDSTVSLSGSHFLADYATGVAATIYLDFLTRSSGGVMIDGTATTTTLPGGSGFFTVDQSTPATESAKSLVITYSNTIVVDPCVSSPDICKPPLPIDIPVVDDVAGDPCATAPDSAQCKPIKLGEKEKDEKDSFGDGEHDENSSQKKVGTCGV